jgi:plastocyanin
MERRSTLPTLVAATVVLSACGGGGGAYDTPSGPAGSAGSGAATIRITAAGVDPRQVRIDRGQQVTFVNADSRSHEMLSDPHPVHTGCPEINEVGHLEPGQSRTTAVFREPVTCGFHDNRQDGVAALRGTIVVGEGGDPSDRY